MKLSQRLSIIFAGGLLLGVIVLEAPHTGRTTISPILKHMTLEEMTQEADLVVRGTITKKIGTFRQTGPAGNDMVYTKWSFSADEFLKGTSQPITVVTPGGQYGTTIVEFEDMAQLPLRQPLVLALYQMEQRPGYYRIEGESQGAYAVENNSTTIRQLFTNESVPMTRVKSSLTTQQPANK